MSTIGILGGMGPRATVAFEALLLERLPGTDQALPTMVTINDGGIPDRTKYLLGAGPDPVPRIQKNLRALERLGADIVALPCNTACAPQIFDRLQPGSCELLNLPKLVTEFMAQAGYRKVYILATEGTVAARVYQDLCLQQGLGCEVPAKSTQTFANTMIKSVKRGRMQQARYYGRRLAERIADTNCDAVILGCTELPLVAEVLATADRQLVNTLEVLADACVTKFQERKTDEPRFVYA